MADASRLLGKIFSPAFSQIRTLIKNKVSRGGIQYTGFKYHPRHPDFKDPPYEPSKLFLVTRTRHVHGTNPIEREVLQKLNIDGHKRSGGHKAIVKNIPEVNEALWRVKHLVTIVPIRCPQGLPQDGALGGSYLHDNGRLDISPRLKVAEDRIVGTEVFQKHPRRLGSELLKRHMRDRWNNPINGTVNEC